MIFTRGQLFSLQLPTALEATVSHWKNGGRLIGWSWWSIYFLPYLA